MLAEVEAVVEKVELVPVMKEDEETPEQFESDLESSESMDGEEAALLEGIVESKPKKESRRKAIEVDDQEREIESLLFGGVSNGALFDASASDDESSEGFDDGMDVEDSDDDQESTFIIGEESENRKKVRIPLNDKFSIF